MRRLGPILLALFVLFAPVAALAAEPDEVAAGIADDGVFVEPGASTTESEIGALVREARNDGENLSIVVLADEPVSGASTFADAVVDRVGRELVIVIAPDSVGYAGTADIYTVDDLETALDVAFERGGDDGDFARSIVESLTGRSVDTGEPATGGTSGDGGGSGFVVFLVIAVLAVGGFLWLRSRSKKREEQAAASRIEAARSEVQRRIDDVANDLLEIEDEVRVADNASADRFYNEAGDTYRAVSDAFAAATSPAELIDLSNRLDVAIWQLDTAEAILDGSDLPPRPEPRRLEPEPAPTRSIDTSRLPAPSYTRRSTRRSSYGAGSSMMDTLLQLGMAYAAGRSSGRRTRSGGGGLGGLLGGIGAGRSTGSSSRSTSRSSRSSSGSSRRGTGGRVRGGRSGRRRG